MIGWVLKKIFGSRHDREVKRLWPIVAQVNRFEEQYQRLSDAELQAKTAEFKARIAAGATTEDILPEAFAAVKNACRRMIGTKLTVTGQEKTWDMIPYDVQLIGGIALHRGSIAEMQTGEGKTLVAILPLYLNALTGKNCQLVTVNDYLAKRDSEWVGTVLKWLGLTVGCIQHDMRPQDRREQYACDVTYGTNAEFGFDYLRDMGMATDPRELVQRGHFFAIVDEVDSILIDEARTPLIIAGPVPNATHQFDKLKPDVELLVRKQNALCAALIEECKATFAKADASDDEKQDAALKLIKVKLGMPGHRQYLRVLEDPAVRRVMERLESQIYSDSNRGMIQEVKDTLYFSIDEKAGDADLSELGRKTIRPHDPEAFVMPDLATQFAMLDGEAGMDEVAKHLKKEELQRSFDERNETLHNLSQLLRAYCVFERDRHYIIEEGKVVIVDEHTGRPMYGRRYSDGLHQALEAKEGVKIEAETQTLATITIQNYFRLYEKLAGMTGTAETEATEFKEIYKLDVLVVPTNRPGSRKDKHDVIYKTRRDKYRAIIEEVKECYGRGQPVLLGTVSVEVSEVLSRLLTREKVIHTVLNAKQHQREAEVVALAGQRGAITIATNMAGRGTDIKLGAGVTDLGGLHVIGSERHDSRRIDRQLRGRCARQGDPGSSRFYISLEDDLMRLFGGDRITRLMERFGFEEGEELSHPMLNMTIEGAQRRVEQHHFSIRKRTLQYDDVMNKQREVIYGERREALTTENPRDLLFGYIEAALQNQVELCLEPTKDTESPVTLVPLKAWLRTTFPPVAFSDADLSWPADQKFILEDYAAKLLARIRETYGHKEKGEQPELLAWLERQIILSAIDRLWQEHLYAMDNLRHGVYLHQHAQRDPLIEYKKEAFKLFGDLMNLVAGEIAANTFRSATTLQAFQRLLHSLPQVEVHQVMGQFDSAARPADSESASGTVTSAPAPMPTSATELVRAASTPAPRTVQAPPSAQPRPAASEAGDPILQQRERKPQTFHRDQPKVGRNDPCPCGSGKKYKKCHGADS